MLSFNGELVYAAYFIAAAAIFDFMDGLVARLLNAYSEIGKQMDSLADVISFGVAPAVIVFHLLQLSVIKSSMLLFMISPDIITMATPFVAFIIVVFSALRLAKFNVDTRQTTSFIGLPTPANAMLFASFPLILEYNQGTIFTDLIMNKYVMIGLILVQSYLLVAEFPMFSLKLKSLKFKENKIRYIFLAICIALLATMKFIAIPLIILIYIVISGINNIIEKKNKVAV